MHTLLQDLRYGIRQLKKHPHLALTACLSLAFGIGATVSVFSIIYAVIINPFPYSEPNRICWVALNSKSDHTGFGLTGEQIVKVEQSSAIQNAMGFNMEDESIDDNGVPDNAEALLMTGNGFQVLGVQPLFGRYFFPSDAPFGKTPAPVVVLSHKFWMRHFSGDRSVVGKTMRLSQKPYQVIGVMPEHFGWLGVDLYQPASLSNDPKKLYGMVVKLKPGVSSLAGSEAVQPLFQQFAKAFPDNFPKESFKVALSSLLDLANVQIRQTLFLLFGAVFLLLLIGCTNVSILLLARGTSRQHELAVRTAVGASASRLLRQLLTESLLLAFAGTLLGVIFAYSTVHLIVVRLPRGTFPNEANFHVHIPVLAFTVAVALLTGVLFGLLPALLLRRPDVSAVMQASSRRVAGSIFGKLSHQTLIAAQVSFTLLLLTAAGMAIMGFIRTMEIPLGYNPHNTVSVAIPLRSNAYADWAVRRQYFEQLRDKISQLPQVTSAAIGLAATPPENGFRTSYQLLGGSTASNQQLAVEFVDTRYFSTLEIPLLQGRLWTVDEITRGAPLAVVNRAFVKNCFNNGQIIGHSIKVPLPKNHPPDLFTASGTEGWLQIVGVVGNVVNDGLDKPVGPAVYLPYSVLIPDFTQIFVHTDVDPRLLEHTVRAQIAKVDPQQQALWTDDALMEEALHDQPLWARGRLISMLLSIFAALALTLAAVGVYSVVSYSVAQRTNEFGIRLALGASKGNLVKLVFRSASISIGAGIALGLALSIGLGQWISHWIADAGHHVLLSLAGSAVMIVMAAIACLAPARKASSVDPSAALRAE
jgi:putative ABC transport system permease protein